MEVGGFFWHQNGDASMRGNENGDSVAGTAVAPLMQMLMVAGAGFEPATFGL